MIILTVTICAMFILLGYEIRYRCIREELENIDDILSTLVKDLKKLKDEIESKQEGNKYQ